MLCGYTAAGFYTGGTDVFNKIDEFLIKIQRNFGGLIMLIVLFCCVMQVVLRMINIAAPWTEEFSRVGLAYITFLMAAFGVRLNAHPSVDFLVKKLPKRVKFSLKILTELLIIVVGLIFIYYGGLYFQRTMTDHSTTYHYAKSWWYWPIPFSGLVTILYCFRNIWHLLLSIKRNEDVTGFIPTDTEKIENMGAEEEKGGQ